MIPDFACVFFVDSGRSLRSSLGGWVSPVRS